MKHSCNGWALCVTAVLWSCAGGCSENMDSTAEKFSTDTLALRTMDAWQMLGVLGNGMVRNGIAYDGSGDYLALFFRGRQGDVADIWVKAQTGAAPDLAAWLVDAQGGAVAFNDNADAVTRDAHILAALPRSAHYYVLFKDALPDPATFSVTLAGSGDNYSSCGIDADCMAIGTGPNCCQNGFTAISRLSQSQYTRDNVCSPSIRCSSSSTAGLRMPQCNPLTLHCEMVLVDEMECGGGVPNPHQCPPGFACRYAPGRPLGRCQRAQSCGGLTRIPCPSPHETCQYDPSCDPSRGGHGECVGTCVSTAPP